MNITFESEKGLNPQPSSSISKRNNSVIQSSRSVNKPDGRDAYLPTYTTSSHNNLDSYQSNRPDQHRFSGIKEQSLNVHGEMPVRTSQSFTMENSFKEEQTYGNSQSQRNLRPFSPLLSQPRLISNNHSTNIKKASTYEEKEPGKFWESKENNYNFSKVHKNHGKEEKVSRGGSQHQFQNGDYNSAYLILSDNLAHKQGLHEECYKREEELQADIIILKNNLKQMQLVADKGKQKFQNGNSSLLDENFKMNISQEEVKALRSEIETKDKSISDLKKSNEQIKKSYQVISLAFNSDRERIVKLEEVVRNLRRENHSLKSDVDEISFKLNSNKQYKEITSKYEEERKINSHLNEEIERYKSELKKSERQYFDIVEDFNKVKAENHVRKQFRDNSSVQNTKVMTYKTSENPFKSGNYNESYPEPESMILNNDINNMTVNSRSNQFISNTRSDSFVLKKKPESSVFQEQAFDSRRSQNLRKSIESKVRMPEQNSLAFNGILERENEKSHLTQDEKSRMISFLKNYEVPSEYDSRTNKASKAYIESLMSNNL
jgi:hypothetical protein